MDWQTLIQRLRDQGMTLSDIARSAEAPVSTISDIARGATKEPRGNVAMKLLAMEVARKDIKAA